MHLKIAKVLQARGRIMNERSINWVLAMTLMTVFVSGCETLDAYTREEQTSNTTKGALIGAGIGVAVGLMSGDDAVERRQHAMIGAGIGALAGGSVGYYMDKQEAELRAELEGTGVSVTRNGDNITLNMPGNVTFATDSSDLSPAFFDVLNSVGTVLDEFDQTVVEVAGHTDSTGSHAYNQSLSERRSASVASYLRGRGVISERLITVGMGETYPIADNNTPDGRQANRRVEITMVPLTGS
jgi:outer membrane protein OmpA-like peptidoglycan-associated protein